MTTRPRPLICTFYELTFALRSLHGWQKPLIDDLHDIWRSGAPTPDSRVLNPNAYDPRIPFQRGNYEKRLVLPTPLTQWVQNAVAQRGIPATFDDAARLVRAAQQAFEGARNKHG